MTYYARFVLVVRCLAGFAMGVSALSASGQTFRVIMDPADPNVYTTAGAVSADGSIVAGNTTSLSTGGVAVDPYMWSAAGGYQNFAGDDPFGASSFEVSTISGDGRVIGGVFNLDDGIRPFLYTESGGFQRIEATSGPRFFTLTDLSNDGSVAVGIDIDFQSGALPVGYRWTESSGMQPIDTLTPGSGYTQAIGVSSDGSIVVGSSFSPANSGVVPIRWTEAGGTQALGNENGRARAVTPTGEVISGSANFSGELEAFRWTEDTGMVPLGALPGGSGESSLFALSDDGSAAVGRSRSGRFGSVDWEAVLWTVDDGLRRLADVLEDDFNIDMTGWQLIEANDISADGTTIVGRAYDPQGINRAFVATIPAPGALVLLPMMGIVANASRARSAGASRCLARSRTTRRRRS